MFANHILLHVTLFQVLLKLFLIKLQYVFICACINYKQSQKKCSFVCGLASINILFTFLKVHSFFYVYCHIIIYVSTWVVCININKLWSKICLGETALVKRLFYICKFIDLSRIYLKVHIYYCIIDFYSRFPHLYIEFCNCFLCNKCLN